MALFDIWEIKLLGKDISKGVSNVQTLEKVFAFAFFWRIAKGVILNVDFSPLSSTVKVMSWS